MVTIFCDGLPNININTCFVSSTSASTLQVVCCYASVLLAVAGVVSFGNILTIFSVIFLGFSMGLKGRSEPETTINFIRFFLLESSTPMTILGGLAKWGYPNSWLVGFVGESHPEMEDGNGGTTIFNGWNHPFLAGVFHEINPPFRGTPMTMETAIYWYLPIYNWQFLTIYLWSPRMIIISPVFPICSSYSTAKSWSPHDEREPAAFHRRFEALTSKNSSGSTCACATTYMRRPGRGRRLEEMVWTMGWWWNWI